MASFTGEYVAEKYAVPKQRLGPDDLVSTWLVKAIELVALAAVPVMLLVPVR